MLAVEQITISAPADSPYSGACFRGLCSWDSNSSAEDGHEMTVLWSSVIYHPYLSLDTRLCSCIVKPCATPAALVTQLQRLLARPELWNPCSSCVCNPAALAELRSEPAFFCLKARIHTPGAAALSDDILRAVVRAKERPPLLPDLAAWLKTGTHSDVKMLAGRTVFQCHRTVLAAQSTVFRDMFATTPDHEVVRLPDDVSPPAWARLLQFLYTGQFTAVEYVYKRR